MVGAVVVSSGEIVGEGWHREYGGDHAEVEALRAAGARAGGATVYVTLEPCSHFGKTPPCTAALMDAGVARVVYACSDPNPGAAGGGEILAAGGVEIEAGVEERSARDLNARFFHSCAGGEAVRPWTELKLALSLDARTADATGNSVWITGEAARAEVHRLRAGHDAIAVGIGTVLADDPELTVRGPIQPRRPPLRLVFDRALRLPTGSRLVRSVDVAPVWVICGSGAAQARRDELTTAGVRVIVAGDLGEALKRIRELGIESLFCEGGGGVASALINAAAVDRLTLFYAPILLGSGGHAGFGAVADVTMDGLERWRVVRRASFDADTLIALAPP